MKINSILSILFIVFTSACVQHSRDPIEESELNLKLNETLEYLNDLESDRKSDDNFYYQRAKTHFQLGQLSKAQSDVTKAINLNAAVADYFMLGGRIEKGLNNPEKAISNLLIAEKMGARDTDLYQILASEYLHLGQAEKAKEAVDRLVNIKSNTTTYTLRGNIFLAINDTTSALKNYNQALDYENAEIEPFLKISNIYRSSGQYEQALKYIGLYITRDSNNKPALIQQARLLSDMGRYDSSLLIYKEVVNENTTDSNLLFELSNVYYAMEEFDSAAMYAQKAYLKDGQLIDALLVGARSMDRSRNYDSAIFIYEMIVSKDSTQDIAASELDILKRKVAYLWRLERLKKQKDSVSNNLPPTINKKSIEN